MNKELMKQLGFGKITEGYCPICKDRVGEFRDELSKEEYKISGMCQACQDEVFKDDQNNSCM